MTTVNRALADRPMPHPRTILLALLLPAALPSQAPRALTRTLDSLVRATLVVEPMAGLSAAVLKGRDTLLLAGYGLADVGLEVPVTPATTFHLVGPTTVMLAAAILQQVEAGKLRLDDDASRLLPDFPWQGRHVTVRQLLDATSGLPDFHYSGDRYLAQRAVPKGQDEVTALFAGLPFTHEPGAKWQWTISGFHLAGQLLERVTGMPYGDYLRERIFAPAGLTRTFYCGDDRTVTPGLAHGYEPRRGRYLNAPPASATLYLTSSGVCGTAGDVAAFARALRDGRLLRPASWRALTTAEGPAAARPVPTDSFMTVGLGVRMSREEGHRWVGTSGTLVGYVSAMMDFPDDSLTVVVLANTGAPTRLARELARVALGLAPTPAPGRPPARGAQTEVAARLTLSPAERARYVGTYVVRPVNGRDQDAQYVRTWRIYDDNGRLTAQALGDPPEPLLAQGDHVFAIASTPGMRFTFTLLGDRATALTVGSNTAQATGPRRKD